MKGSLLLGIVRHESMDLTLFIRFGIFTLYCLGLTSAEAVFRDRQQGGFHVVIIFALIVTDLFTPISFRD